MANHAPILPRGWILRSRIAPLSPFFKGAAAGIAFMGLALGGLFTLNGAPIGFGRQPSDSRIIISTRSGHQSSVQLSDGSQVQLAPDSRIIYSQDFGVTTREVEIDGEAIFTVNPSSSVPFVVLSRGTRTQVLGTRFGVRAYQSDTVVQVAVESGRVRVGSGTATSAGVVQAGELVLIKGNTLLHKQQRNDISDVIGWSDNRLVYKKVALRDLLHDLERWYNVTIVDGGSPDYNPVVTAQFDNADIDLVLNILSRNLGVTFVRVGRTVSIRR
jgi:transmembrane sensor